MSQDVVILVGSNANSGLCKELGQRMRIVKLGFLRKKVILSARVPV
jgi:hypothetical protein